MNACRSLIIASIVVLMAACSSTNHGPQPSPLPVVQNKVQIQTIWHQSLGSLPEVRLHPALRGNYVAALSADANLRLLNANTGGELWRVKVADAAAGGVGLGEALVVVGTIKGELLAYGLDAKLHWSIRTGSAIAAPPVVTNAQVLVRGSDGRLSAYSAQDGSMQWVYARQQPALLLRNFAPAIVSGDRVYFGQAGGRLAALNVKDGRVLWETQVAQAHGASEIERIADIVTPPVTDDELVCAVAYQGRLACFNAQNGSTVWSRDVSSGSGLDMDAKAVYVTDDKGYVIAYERSSGRNLWRQDKLVAREVSAPSVMGRTLIVGDYQGYTHFIDTEDGSFVGQYPTDGGAILVAPQMVGERWLVQTQKGGLYLLGRK